MNLEKISQKKTLVFILLLTLVLIFYSNIFANGFVYDDNDFFINWESVKSLKNIPSLVAGDLPLAHQHVYRPLRSALQSLFYAAFGENVFYYHLFSIIVHTLNTFYVFLIVRKLAGKTAGFFAAAIFAVLPVHVEAVTFIAASFDTAGLIFLLASFYLYLLFSETEKKKFLLYSLLLALIANLFYEIALILPLLIILFDCCFKNPDGKPFFKKIKYHLLYFLTAILYLTARLIIISFNQSASFLTEISIGARLPIVFRALAKYLYLAIFNYPLNIEYPTDLSQSPFGVQTLAAFFLVLGLILTAFYLFKKGRKEYSFIIFWFFFCLLPIINIIRIASFVAERYLYLASFAWALLLGLIFSRLYQKNEKRKTAVLILFAVLIFIYGGVTYQRNKDWKDDAALWTKTLEKNNLSYKAYNNLAYSYRKEGQTEPAIEYLKKAIALNPNYHLAFENLGEIYLDEKKYDLAIENFNQAIALEPSYAVAYSNLGFTYYLLGEKEKALENYEKAVKLDPDYYQANLNLGALYFENQNYELAIECFNRALKINSGNYEVYEALGMSYLAVNNLDEAKKSFEKALEINPQATRTRELLEKK